MTREDNPRDRLFNPDPDTSDYRDRTEFGPEPVDETEDTVEEPEAHRPRPADEDRGTSEAIADEGGREEHNPGTEEMAATRGAFVTAPQGREDDEDVAVPREQRASDAAWHESEPADVGGEPGAADVRDEVPAPAAVPAAVPEDVDQTGALLPASDADQIRTRWHEVQAGFVDDPRTAVDEAAQLVSHASDRITSVLKDRLGVLDEGRSTGKSAGDETATEQLRSLMQRYHVLLDRLLAV